MLAADENDQERNSLRNSTVLLAQIYNFRVIKAGFLIELMDKLRTIESPISLSMLAELFTCGVLSTFLVEFRCLDSGMTLKKRDGSVLSSFVSRLHEQLENMPKEKFEE